MSQQKEFLCPRSKYYGEFTPEELVLNANLQEFFQSVSYLCALETGGKISTDEAYQGVKRAWKELKHSKKGLGIGKNQQPPSEEI
ncbi:MAG: hypothetical protein AAFW84_10650 [Cyanobacteria bacterium J06635_15]